MEKIFNINDYVKVKLTPEGKKILKEQYQEMLKQMSPRARQSMGPFKLPEKDKDGYYKFQLWEVMKHFGRYCYNGNVKSPFYNNIKISSDDLKDVNQ